MAEELSKVNSTLSDEVPDPVERVEQTAARSITADRVEMRNAAAQTVNADAVGMHSSAAQQLNADTARLVQSAAFSANTETLAVEQSNLGWLRAADATLADSRVFALVSDRVQAANVSTVWLIARHVEGDVKALIDPRCAAMLGATFGGVVGVFMLVSGLLRRSR